MQPRVTIQTLAHLAQCSRTTASLALRDDPQIPAATRERIQRLARETGYLPETPLQSHTPPPPPAAPPVLAALGTLHTVSRRFAVETACYADWMMGAADRGAQMGYLFEDFWLCEGSRTLEELEAALEEHRIQGLLLPCFPSAERLPRELHSLVRRYPAAVAGYPSPELPELPAAANDRAAAGAALFDRATRAGYSRIGFVLGQAGEEREGTHLALAAAEAYDHFPELPRLPVLQVARDGTAEFLHWLSINRPECIITTRDEMWDWLHEARLRVPQDTGLLFWQLHNRTCGWSGMVQNDREIGAAALELIVRQLEGGESSGSHSRVLVGSTWVEGGTIRSLVS